jgi:hypothetical protein
LFMPTNTAMQPLPSKPNELTIFLWVVKGYVDKNKDHDNFVSRTFRLTSRDVVLWSVLFRPGQTSFLWVDDFDVRWIATESHHLGNAVQSTSTSLMTTAIPTHGFAVYYDHWTEGLHRLGIAALFCD